MGFDEMRALLLDVRNVLSLIFFTSMSPKIRIFQSSILFPTSKPIDRIGSTSFITTKIDHIRFVIPSGGWGSMTLAGSLYTLNIQSSFDLVFGHNPLIIHPPPPPSE